MCLVGPSWTVKMPSSPLALSPAGLIDSQPPSPEQVEKLKEFVGAAEGAAAATHSLAVVAFLYLYLSVASKCG